MRIRTIYTGVLMLLLIGGCDNDPKSSLGFTLPDGNVEIGQRHFVELGCVYCHSIAGKEDILVPPNTIEPILNVVLGGATTRIATYGQLVTSIINPSHKVSPEYRDMSIMDEGQSMMRDYNSIMTVDELIHIVAFVQDQYVLEPVKPTIYRMY